MSSSEIINHVNTTLYNILRESLESLGPELSITFGSPADEDGSGDTAPRLSVFLYNIIEDPFSRNRPDEFRGGNRILSFKRPLAVNLYYMLTPFSGPSGSTDANARIRVQAHNMIALTMRAFYNNGLINPKYFPGNTTLGESQVRLSPVQMNLEEITKIWSSFNKPFRLSVCYEVSIVRIQAEKPPKEAHIAERAVFSSGANGPESEFEVLPAIGKKNVSKLKEKGWNLVAMSSDDIGGISEVRPLAVQPGMALNIYGKNFNGKKLILKIGDRTITDAREIDAQVDAEVDKAIRDSEEINETLLRRLLKALLSRLLGTSFRVINENLIKVKIPFDEKPGTNKKLSLKAEDGDEAVATFEVLLSEPGVIRITEVRPERDIIAGDVISVYGINFTEPVEATVNVRTTDNQEVRKKAPVTFVDNAQINIMIPPDTPAGKAKLTAKFDKKSASTEFMIQKRDE